MKQYIYLLVAVLLGFSLQSCIVSSKPSISYFKEKENQKNAQFTSINVPTFLAKTFLKSKLRNEGESEEVINLLKKVKDIKIMTSQNMDTSTMSDYMAHLSSNQFEEWMSVKDSDGTIRINARQTNDVIDQLLIIIDSDQDAVFVDVKGKFTADDISKLINAAENNKSTIKIKKS